MMVKCVDWIIQSERKIECIVFESNIDYWYCYALYVSLFLHSPYQCAVWRKMWRRCWMTSEKTWRRRPSLSPAAESSWPRILVRHANTCKNRGLHSELTLKWIEVDCHCFSLSPWMLLRSYMWLYSQPNLDSSRQTWAFMHSDAFTCLSLW